jgi:hypothetical protein
VNNKVLNQAFRGKHAEYMEVDKLRNIPTNISYHYDQFIPLDSHVERPDVGNHICYSKDVFG